MESSSLLGASTLYDFVTRLDGMLMILGGADMHTYDTGGGGGGGGGGERGWFP